jgi:hypothetical protein
VFSHSPDGVLDGVRVARLESCTGHTLFEKPLTTAYIFSSLDEGPYRVAVAIVPFEHKSAWRESCGERSQKIEAEVESLRRHLLSSTSGEQSDAIGSVSVFRASKALSQGISTSTIAGWRRALQVESQASIACAFHDVAVLPGLFSNARRTDYTVVCEALTTPIEGAGDSLVISRTIYRLIEQLARQKVLLALNSRVRKLPLAKFAPSKYVHGITSGRTNILSAYLSQHLEDREKTIAGLLDTELRLARLVAEDEFIASQENWKSIVVPSYKRRGQEIKGDFTLRFVDSVTLLRELVSSVHRNMSMSTEHLRDLLAANVADSNLRLQRTLYWVALGAVGIALMGLFIGLLTDDAKKYLAQSVLELFSWISKK